MLEVWRAGGTGELELSLAEALEAEGWDGQVFMDSQALGADPYVLMTAWAARTERLRLAPGVTNPFTRHLSVTASSIAAVQAVSSGRAVLGIGRGDSALAYIGHAPVRLGAFRRSLEDLQTLLAGGSVEACGQAGHADAPLVETMSLGDRPDAFRLKWLPPGLPKTPLDVAATGPKVIEMAAPIAERLTFSVGAIPERLEWAVGLARAARARAGLGDAGVSLGAQVIVICHPDRTRAIELAKSTVAPLARFQVIQGSIAGPVRRGDDASFSTLRRAYDMTKHGDGGTASKLVDADLAPDFIERFAVVGPPEECFERLTGLIRCGLDRLIVVGPYKNSLFAREVMPALRMAARETAPA